MFVLGAASASLLAHIFDSKKSQNSPSRFQQIQNEFRKIENHQLQKSNFDFSLVSTWNSELNTIRWIANCPIENLKLCGKLQLPPKIKKEKIQSQILCSGDLAIKIPFRSKPPKPSIKSDKIFSLFMNNGTEITEIKLDEKSANNQTQETKKQEENKDENKEITEEKEFTEILEEEVEDE